METSKIKNEFSLGSWITLNNPSVAEIMADAGFNWLCVDLEHTSIDYNDAQQLILSIQSKGLKAFVRVGENNPRIIKRVLDAGADGIIVPMVNSKNDALKAVNSVKYPPKGKRGVGLSRAQGYGFNFEKYRDQISKQIILIAQIEHIDAVNNLKEIIETDGIDGTFIGPYDLSGSLGKPGEYNDPNVKKAIKKYESIALNYDKLVGYHSVPVDYKLVLEKKSKGYNFIAFSFDAYFLGETIRNQLQHIKLKS
jgi:2-dehydro-3-deoxyglucarate aldolase